ncbi:beta-ketoacyl-[acyl-carrier-protein] synthase family protein [Lipingzhangella sp. LS1_29]|uniref:Beta-ketoacyl-[acyl-carrier-protein] synthase family protein n=1 Tax=Lipingzhangella rawalii TaxID=2055835 RepID=A0ABU2HC92_9ACTN|nr:beta-ketoacyl-[acyl-carrier-protein] synthase family protein [Lipingzhangella rawalii]MDS1272469.1 beta-ketoacyl-[acyl-carrier-protein] synthase family protein [Lipingzhangella rawalii]
MPFSSRDSVVITGWGVVTPAGCTPKSLWDQLYSGRSTAAPLANLDPSGNRPSFGCPVRGLEETDVGVSAKEARRTDPFARYGVTAALGAHRDAAYPETDPDRTAIVIGNAVGGRHTSDHESRQFTETGPHRVNPLMPLMTMPNAAAARIAMLLGWHGPAVTIATTCSSGADAVGHAMLLLQTHRADVVIAGGCEATLTPVTLAGFRNLNATSTRYDEPERASRPFDATRDGFVMGEGAGCVVLERHSDAMARGAVPYAEVAGYAATSDAHHLSMPAPGGAGAAAAMAAAIRDAELTPEDIVHVNAHGTSTPHNDRAEAAALGAVFGADPPPVTAPKGVLGHLIGAAGTVELVATVQAMWRCEVPPTANHDRLEPGLDIDVVHGQARAVSSGAALTNSFGFGGHNSALVVRPA